MTILVLIFPLDCTFLKLCTGKLFNFFIPLLFIIFSNRNRMKFIIIFFLFVRQIIFAAISPVIIFFLEMVSCSIKILKLLVVLIYIFDRYHLCSWCLLLTIHSMIAERFHCYSIIITLGCHNLCA